MFQEKLKAVVEQELKAKQAREALETLRIAELKALPATYGYKTLEEFVKALKEAAGKRVGRPAKGAKAAAPKAEKKRKRTKVTDELRSKIVADLTAKAKTAAAIAKEYGVSYPTVMNIKKAAGLIEKSA